MIWNIIRPHHEAMGMVVVDVEVVTCVLEDFSLAVVVVDHVEVDVVRDKRALDLTKNTRNIRKKKENRKRRPMAKLLCKC